MTLSSIDEAETLERAEEGEMLERAVGDADMLETSIGELLMAETELEEQISPFSGRHLSLLPFLPFSGIAAPTAMVPKARIAVTIVGRMIDFVLIGKDLYLLCSR